MSCLCHRRRHVWKCGKSWFKVWSKESGKRKLRTERQCAGGAETGNTMNALKADIHIEKAFLRKQVLERRNRMEEPERTKAAILLTERILGHQWYYLSDTLLGFVSFGSEIDTTEILKDALAKGKKVYLPKITGSKMDFFRIESLEELVEGYKGILEPTGTSECFTGQGDAAEKTFLLMPGVAFDLLRNRIGYGKGYYDRYLQDKEALQLRTVAVGFECQMVESVPAEEADIRPCQVICV